MLTEYEQSQIAESIGVLEREIDSYGVNLGGKSLRHYLRLKLAIAPFEQFGVVLINSNNKVISVDTLFYGGVGEVAVNLRALAAHVLSSAATSVALFHNHPDIQYSASRQDVNLSKRVINSLRPFGVHCIDHFIVAGDIYSMAADSAYSHLFQSPEPVDQNVVANSAAQEMDL